MKAEYSKILPCLERHKGSCIALKPTSLISPEKIQKLGSNLKQDRYPEINLDKHLKSGEVEEVSLPLTELAEQATQRGVRLLIDAEQSELQPAVDLIALYLMKRFNNGTNTSPLIYNTYQLYLQDSGLRLLCHQKWLQESGSELAAKMVRGAYLSHEIGRKADAHPNYQLCPNKAATDRNYDLNASRLAKENCSAIFATHNSRSVELLVQLVSNNQSSKCEFAYLMGFRPRIATLLRGHKTLEYVPYGPTNVKIPYLLRRLEENTDAFDNKS
jgi:proline dehydrogenase